MRIFTYSEARQNLASLLNIADNEEVVITRRDGSRFNLTALSTVEDRFPFDVPGIASGVSTREIIDTLREGRETDRHDG